MPAIIGKAAQLPVAAAQQHDRPAWRVEAAVIAGSGQLVVAAEKEPVLEEDHLPLAAENLRIGVETCRH